MLKPDSQQVADPEKGCITYDPRKRPWYILATAVVKDLVILLDTGQQNNKTFNLSVNITSELFDTLRINDTVNVVTFNSDTAGLQNPYSVRKLIIDPGRVMVTTWPFWIRLIDLILIICSSFMLQALADSTAQSCGEFSVYRAWRIAQQTTSLTSHKDSTPHWRRLIRQANWKCAIYPSTIRSLEPHSFNSGQVRVRLIKVYIRF